MFRAAPGFHVVLATLGCFGGGSLYGWSGYLPSVRAEFGVSNAVTSMVFSLALVSFTLGVLLGPMLFGRAAPRIRLPLLTGLAALSLGISGGSTEFTRFVITYGVVFGFATGALYNHTISMASATAAPTLLVPVSVAAFGLGGAVFGPLQLWLSASGWGLWSNLPALVCLSIVTITAFVLGSPPEASIAKQNAPRQVTKPNKTSAVLWVIFAAGSCSGLIVLGFAAQILPQAADGVGLASLAIFLAALGNTLGRLSCAFSARVFGPARGIAGSLVLSMLALSCLIVTTAPGVVVVLLFLVAFAYGQLAATMPLLVRSQVNAPSFSGTFGWVFTGWGFAGLVGPWTAGGLVDATGTLQVPLVVCMVMSALGLWLVIPFTKQGRCEETR